MTTSAGSSTAGQSVVQGTQRTQVPLGQGRQTAQDGRQLLWYYRLRVQYHGIHLKKRDNESKKIAVRVIKEELTGFGFYQNGKEWFLGSDEVVFVLAL